jgi:hypothetical protein
MFDIKTNTKNNFEKSKKIMEEYYFNNQIIFSNKLVQFKDKFCYFIELVNYWTQILGLVIYKSSYPDTRKYLIKNLIDENLSDLTHVDTFYNFLLECGYVGDVNELIMISKQNQIIIKYKKLLENFILNNDFSDCVEMLGSIEYVYHLISRDINKYFIIQYYIEPSFHFDTHEILDQTHAKELLESSGNQLYSKTNIEFGSQWIVNVIKELIH